MDPLKKLVHWLEGDSQRPAALISSKLHVNKVDVTGRSLVANSKIAKNEPLITVPHSYLLNYVTILKHLEKSANWDSPINSTNYIYVPEGPIDPIYANFELSKLLQLSSFQLVSLYLVLEKQKPESYWKPFIDVLPSISELDGMPMIWALQNDPIFDLLPNSIKEHSKAQQEKFLSDYNAVQEFLLVAGLDGTSLVPQDDFLWAWVCCNSRCLYMELPEILDKQLEDNFTLVPFVDFINHAPEDHCSVSISSTKGFQVTSGSRPYGNGDQIFFSYGAHSDEFLLCEYGFMLPPCCNPCNSLDITPYILKLLKGEQSEFLKKHNYYGEYTLTSNEMSFRTEIALATLQEKDLSKILPMINGMSEGAPYKKNTNLLVEKILHKIQAASKEKQEELRRYPECYRTSLVIQAHHNINIICDAYIQY
ncbi:hypothetical protein OGATHE_002826 [Ogataea polymorpha]|uniref:SET domain-containing protein n=1 Tax=Ogataea polymorpha TaxID=460523 RepID=A0A9P8PD12_9ASCO|nr:hypothetical protein OGATHE_002826 [Ogataea polymorpha]